MTSEAIEIQGRKGTKIEGLFGMFDILGYKSLIKKDIDYVLNVYYNSIYNRHLAALAFADSHMTNLQPSVQPKLLAFSDTFIFYQEFYPNEEIFKKLQRVSAFIISSCYLLRLAFEGGIPLRGAISFGEYYIDKENMIFLGHPIVEAHDLEVSQDWSGAVLCDSAYNLIKPMIEDKDLKSQILQIKTNEDCKLCNRTCPFDLNEYLVEYGIPYKGETQRGMALRWDDFAVRDLFGIGLENININSVRGDLCECLEIYGIVKERFGSHDKGIDDREIKNKIENTSKFFEYINNIFLKEFKMKGFKRSYIPSKINRD